MFKAANPDVEAQIHSFEKTCRIIFSRYDNKAKESNMGVDFFMLSSPRTHGVQIVIEQTQKGMQIEVMKATVACCRDVVSFEARLARMVKKAISGEVETLPQAPQGPCQCKCHEREKINAALILATMALPKAENDENWGHKTQLWQHWSGKPKTGMTDVVLLCTM